jgi:hypothetical protein
MHTLAILNGDAILVIDGHTQNAARALLKELHIPNGKPQLVGDGPDPRANGLGNIFCTCHSFLLFFDRVLTKAAYKTQIELSRSRKKQARQGFDAESKAKA